MKTHLKMFKGKWSAYKGRPKLGDKPYMINCNNPDEAYKGMEAFYNAQRLMETIKRNYG